MHTPEALFLLLGLLASALARDPALASCQSLGTDPHQKRRADAPDFYYLDFHVERIGAEPNDACACTPFVGGGAEAGRVLLPARGVGTDRLHLHDHAAAQPGARGEQVAGAR
jgi:hypothetical protein